MSLQSEDLQILALLPVTLRESLNLPELCFLNLQNRDINILLTSQGWKIIELMVVKALDKLLGSF